jgi:predicted DsbA family dithiol-disulfide isomerase
LKEKHGFSIQWRAFPLHPETPKEGMTLESLFKGRMVDISGMMARLRDAAAAEGLPFGERNMTYNSRLAQELGKWAESEGEIEDYNRGVFQAYFAQGRNIGETAVLMAVAESAGLNPKEAEKVLAERRFSRPVDADWERSRQLGIRAVPTFVMNGRMLVGAQPETELDAFVRF